MKKNTPAVLQTILGKVDRTSSIVATATPFTYYLALNTTSRWPRRMNE